MKLVLLVEAAAEEVEAVVEAVVVAVVPQTDDKVLRVHRTYSLCSLVLPYINSPN